MKRIAVTIVAVLWLCGFSIAQSNEVGFLAGGIFTSDKSPGVCTISFTTPSCPTTIVTPTRISYEGMVAHRLINLHLASLHFELPIVGTPTRTLEQAGFRQDYSTIFFTPGVRLTASLPFFTPFAAVGGGFARYSPSASGMSNPGSSTVGAYQAGGGFDLTTPIPLISFRAEARFFHNGTPNFNVGQNQVFAGAGLILKF